MLTRVTRCWLLLRGADTCYKVLTHVTRCWHMLWCADTCYEVLTCVTRCWHVLRGADTCYEVLARVTRCWHVLRGADMRYEVLIQKYTNFLVNEILCIKINARAWTTDLFHITASMAEHWRHSQTVGRGDSGRWMWLCPILLHQSRLVPSNRSFTAHLDWVRLRVYFVWELLQT